MGVKSGSGMTSNSAMFATMLFGAVFRRKSRALMAVVATLVGAATLFCLAAICIVVPQQMSDEMRAYGANIIVTPLAGEWKNGIDRAMVLHTNDMVLAKGAMRFATYRYENVRINAAPYVLAGVDVSAVKSLNKHWNVDGAWPSSGNVMVGRDVASAMGLKIGSRIAIAYRAGDNSSDSDSLAQKSQGNQAGNQTDNQTDKSSQNKLVEGRVSTDIMDTHGTTFRVCGILDTGDAEDSMLYATNADLRALTGVKRGADVIAYSSSAPNVDAVVRSINDMTSMRVRAQQVTKVTAADTGIIAMLRSLFWIVSLVVLALMMVGVSTTISSIVQQRRNEIGLRKALGASAKSIGIEFTAESGLYGFIGGIAGTAVGYGFARLLASMVFSRDLSVNWWLVVFSIVFSVAASCVAALPPVLRASKIDPAIVLREE
ncbi:ABC transporter permease [Gardnerella vaginalis]|uniref:Efflux ABC transporter, permease protein n=1 Tax=Gardnerella vaginalis (strain ATCC 14019 / 317) TaxID=525284 RepID=E3D8C2_GARV3|nr:ABC transporter permease [Gardnerella vaginalis]ADP39435.1 efflux ABC transporter, permease protein [Gardnerella vaginalis ATCC 14019]KOS09407.1 ABC transporter permease [Gardnerella vaginalis]RFT24027.1 ABC transporter permease [Gardnerella vaginalis]TCH80630.1 ABC transporter permease [Gardnerella vaginalis]TCH82097.1 ABC transporter permease [Gardnerella vaginalis ATCC 14018 = JCM 11026]